METNRFVLETHRRVKSMGSGVQTNLSLPRVHWRMRVNRHPWSYPYDYRNKSVWAAFTEPSRPFAFSRSIVWSGRYNYDHFASLVWRPFQCRTEKWIRERSATISLDANKFRASSVATDISWCCCLKIFRSACTCKFPSDSSKQLF